jgi:hypothetical protein
MIDDDISAGEAKVQGYLVFQPVARMRRFDDRVVTDNAVEIPR